MANRTVLAYARTALVALVALVAAFLLAACGNPFQVGFGDNVDIDRPVVSLDTPSLGSFLRGAVTFAGAASDDVAISSVSISFDRGRTWSAAAYDTSARRWSHQLDTLTKPNGSLSVMVRATDNTGKQTTTEELLFTVDNEAPGIFFTFPAINPATYDEANPPTVGKNGAIFGTVTDREAIALEYPKIRFWRVADPEPDTWTSTRDPLDTSLPSVYDFRYNIPTEQVGDFFLRVTARDVGGQVRTMPPDDQDGYRIVVVSGAPQIAFTAPQQASYVRSTTVVAGSTSHETGNQPEITLRFSERDAPDALLTVTPADPGFSITSDGSGGFNWEYVLDTTSAGPGGTPLPDGTIIAQAYAEIGDTTGFDNLVFLVDNTPPTAAVTTPGYLDTVYSLVTVRGTTSDNSGVDEVAIKVGTLHDYEFLLGTYNWQHTFDSNVYNDDAHADEWDPIADAPQDGTGIWRLPIRLRVTDAAGNQTEIEHLLYIDQDQDKPTVTVLSPAAASNLAGPVLVTGTAFDADPGVLRVEMQIVAVTDPDDPIHPDTAVGNVAPDGSALGPEDWHVVSGTTQWSREINANGALYSVTAPGGAYEGSGFAHHGRLRLRIRAVDGNGKLGNVQELAIRLDETIPSIFDITPASGSYVRGVFEVKATVTDDEEIVSVAVSEDGGVSYSPVYDGPGLGLKEYNLDYEVDTGPSGLNVTSQLRSFWIRARDNANYTTISTVTLNIDNYWPDGELVTTTWNPMHMAGAAFEIRGNAWDRDRGLADSNFPVRGIDTIDVYFEDLRPGFATGDFYRISGGATTTADLQDLGNGQGPRPVVTSEAHRIRIDRTHIGSLDFKAIEVDGSDSTWWTRVDSTQLPDGAMRVHFLLTDRAGNATHRSESGFVRNNPPVIDSVTVGTDLDYDGDVTAGERFVYEGQFNARGTLYVAPGISGGNGTPGWELFEEGDTETPLPVVDEKLDISNAATWPDGEYTFVVRVTDDVGIVVDTPILVRIDQTDSTPPSLTVNGIPVASDGHVEAESPLNPGRPSVSGTVVVSGTAWDNQRIREIRITAPGIGTNVLAAEWEAAPTHDLVSRLAGFTVTSSTLDETAGHEVSWEYLWDTTTHPSRAALGVGFEMSVQDFRSGSPPAVTESLGFDVVPYITDVLGELEAGTRRFIRRSATGSYPVRQGQTIRIMGHNIVGPALAVSTAGTIVEEIGSGEIVFEVGPAAESGALTVSVNGVTSINNMNDNGLAQNQEPESYRPLLTDDRRLTVWRTESDTSLAGRTDAVMGPADGGSGFDWMTVENSQRVFLGAQRLTNSWTLSGGWFDRNSDGTLMYIFLHDMNWRSGFDSYQYHGSVQFGIGDLDQGPAYNWQNLNTNRLGLGNLSFIDDPNWPGYNDKVMSRYRNLRMRAIGDNDETRIHAFYFDTSPATRGIVYYTFRVGRGTNYGVTQMGDSGGQWYSDLTKQAERTGDYSTTWGTNVGLRTPQNRVEVTSAGADSRHFDFAYADGSLYLAYYDESTGRFLLTRNTDAANNPGSWDAPIELDIAAGLYPSIVVDPAGNIHIAYYDTAQGNLKYVYLENIAAPVQPVVLDALFTNGMYAAMDVREFATNDYRPVISHFSLSYSGTPYALRLSYPLSSAALHLNGANPATGDYTGEWEMLPVMADVAPGQNPTFLALDANGNPVVGFNGPHVQEVTLMGGME